jgi:hypothetical protein
MAATIERKPKGMNIGMSNDKPSYSYVVTVSGTDKFVYIAGQLAWDIDSNCLGKWTCGRRWSRRLRTANLDSWHFEVATPISTTVVVTTLAGPCSIVEIAQGK